MKDATLDQSGTTVPAGPGPHRPLGPGHRVGRYTIHEQLGAGGMGQVFAAFDPALGRAVALKLIHPARVGAAAYRARFLREAKALARVSHPNVVSVFDAGSTGEQIYVAMELIEGVTLSAWLREAPRSWRQIRDVFLAAGRGLEAVHAAGLVHRDFKPQNVMVAPGRVVVLDFGLVRACTDGRDEPGALHAAGDALAAAMTLSGEVLGTPRYMSPEQLTSGTATARSDQFSFCVGLYEALAGHPPFAGESLGEHETSRKRGAPAVRDAVRVPRFLAAAVERGLRADPEARHASMSALLRELERDPARTARRWLAACATAAALVTATAIVDRAGVAGAADSCAAASRAIDATWAPARRATLAGAFAALPGPIGAGAWHRTLIELDGWAARWRAERVEVCQAETTHPSPLVTARRACLDRRLTELDSLLGALAAPDVTAARYAVSAAHALAPPETCLGATPVGAGAPPPAVALDEVGRARARLDTATSLRRLGKPRPSLAVAQAVALEAERLAWAPFIAEAQLEVGAANLALRSADAAGDSYYRALWSAEAAGDDALRFEATLGLERVEVEQSSYEEAGRALQTASAIDARLPGDPSRGARLAQLGASLARMRGRYRDCVSRGDDAVARAERSRGPASPEVALALQTLAECHGSLGEVELAQQLLVRALAITETRLGHDQQETASILSDLAVVARHAGRLDEAERRLREVLAIRERILGPDGPDCAAARNNLANVLLDQHRLAEAATEIDRALDIWQRAWGPDSPAVAVCLSVRGAIAMADGRLEDAERDYRRSLEIRRAKRSGGHPDTVRALQRLATVLIAEGKPGAVPLLEEARAAVREDREGDGARAAELDALLIQARGVPRHGSQDRGARRRSPTTRGGGRRRGRLSVASGSAAYSARSSPVPPISAGRSRNLGSPSRMRKTVSP